jgi:hypothetical protein
VSAHPARLFLLLLTMAKFSFAFLAALVAGASAFVSQQAASRSTALKATAAKDYW